MTGLDLNCAKSMQDTVKDVDQKADEEDDGSAPNSERSPQDNLSEISEQQVRTALRSYVDIDVRICICRQSSSELSLNPYPRRNQL